MINNKPTGQKALFRLFFVKFSKFSRIFVLFIHLGKCKETQFSSLKSIVA